MNRRKQIVTALKGHRLDSMSQDSGSHCECGSDSRYDQRYGDFQWKTIDEHRADMIIYELGL